jgi:hypothetical protein
MVRGCDHRLVAQRRSLSSASTRWERRWDGRRVLVSAATGAQQFTRVIGQRGGAIITFKDSRNAIDYDIYARRITSAGCRNGQPMGGDLRSPREYAEFSTDRRRWFGAPSIAWPTSGTVTATSTRSA